MDKNIQNKQIKENLANVTTAVTILQGLGLTVNGVSVLDSRPQVMISQGYGCRHLESGYTKHLVRDGRRIVERVSIVSECLVRWEERQ